MQIEEYCTAFVSVLSVGVKSTMGPTSVANIFLSPFSSGF